MAQITIEVNDLDNYDIRELERILHKTVSECQRRLDGKKVRNSPNEDDYFFYNNVRSCSLRFMGYDDYFITENGDVYSEKRFSVGVKLIKPYYIQNQYSVTLCTGGKVKRYCIGKLVAVCFVENKCNGSFIRYKDNDRTNTKASNIEWVYNTAKRSKSTGAPCKPICKLDLETGAVLGKYNSVKEAAEQCGCKPANISVCLRGKQKQAYGFRWVYDKK